MKKYCYAFVVAAATVGHLPAQTVYIPGGSSGIGSISGSNVGVGTDTPAKTLSVAGNGLLIRGAAGSSAIHLRGVGTGLAFNRDADTGSIYNSSAYAYQWQRTESTTAANDNLALQVYTNSGSQVTPNAFAITGAGNVGIGTASAGYMGSLLQIQTDQNATTRAMVKNDSSGASAASEFVLNAWGNTWALGMGSSANNSNAFYIGKDIAGGTPAAKYFSITTGGNVGIGTTSPGTRLEVTGTTKFKTDIGYYGTRIGSNAGGDSYVWLGSRVGVPAIQGQNDGFTSPLPLALQAEGGNVGIGTTSPGARLEVTGTTKFKVDNGYYGTRIGSNAGGDSYVWIGSRIGVPVIQGQNDGFTSPLPLALQAEGGNVGIGTTNPGTYKLAVVGKIHATEVVVETGWSDYVFADDYRLAPLSEVEAHIKAEKHLPGIPSAAEVAQGGISLGDMQAKLLAKVEELTLHVIEMKKENAAQSDRLGALEQENVRLRQQLSALVGHP